jgi:starch-binding outer membrane protein, SusD/RagB family
MRRNINVALVSLGLLLGTAGCNSFLTGDKLSTDPNNPATATIQTLLVGIQGGQFAFQEGTVPMMVCMWMQQCGATNGRFVEQAGRYVFGAGSNIGANGTDWATIYTGGGLIDMDTIAKMASAAGDSIFLGIDLVWKAFTLGSATDLWGSIPYTDIRTSPTPALDSQLVLYDTVQAMLSTAIRKLTSGVATLPTPHDLVLGGDPAKWIAVAHTLKARYFLHTVEAAANGKLGARTVANVFTDVVAEATNGISDATGASDFRAFHTGNGYPQSNAWFTFQDNSAFGGDLESGKALVDYMNARNDPRRADYFCQNAAGGYGGDDFNVPQADVSAFDCEPTRFSAAFRVPFATYQENQLILAEANLALGNNVVANTHLNAALAVVPLPADTVTGATLLDSIMMEKYVVMFQNIEALSDYRRTCIPNLVPVAPNVLGLPAVPGELFYPQTERNANSNVPTESQEVIAGVRTQSDVHPCTGAGAQAYP